MYINYQGQELKFTFHHITETAPDVPQKGTICVVTTVKDDKFVAKSFSRLHPNDNFDRAKGRQISFGKALQEFVDKKDRLEFWTAYSNWRSTTPRMTLGVAKPAKLKIV